MKTPRIAGITVAVALLTAGWCYQRSGLNVQTPLLDHFDETVKQPRPDLFLLTDVALNGETKRAVALTAPTAGTRITWKRVRVPDDAWLRVYIGIQPQSVVRDGGGVLFFIGVTDGRTFDEVFKQTVNPSANPDDRGWLPIMVDLSLYAGEEVDLVFNTRSVLPWSPDQPGELGVWGAPEIVR